MGFTSSPSPAGFRRRRLAWPAVVLLGFLLAVPVLAQNSPPEPELLERVTLELWPDYDRPALLVIGTVVLPAEAPIPATVRLPLPAGATLNAIAYNDPQGRLLLVPDYQIVENEIVLTAPAPALRLEYYLPIASEGDERSVAFTWTPFDPVARLEITVQEPRAAADFSLASPIEQLVVTDDGLRYHQLPPRTLAAGETAVVNFRYALPGGVLTAAPAVPAADSAGSSNGLAANLRANWPWVAGGLALLLASLVLIGQGLRDRRRATRRTRKPRRRPAGFCPHCGTKRRPEDRFCRSCGRPLE